MEWIREREELVEILDESSIEYVGRATANSVLFVVVLALVVHVGKVGCMRGFCQLTKKLFRQATNAYS